MPKLSEWRGVIAAVVCVPYVFGGLFSSSPEGHTHGLPLIATQVDSLDIGSRPPELSLISVHRATIVRADDLSGRLLSMPWRLIGIHDGGRTLVLYYVAGDGIGITNVGFQVIQTPRVVEILAVSRSTYGNGPEPAPLSVGVVRIVLSAPLGKRPLLHALTDWSADLLAH